MILAVLGQGLLPFDTPVVRADDEGFLRGDACFDTARVVVAEVTAAGAAVEPPGDPGARARVEQLDEHLARFAASADRLALPTVPTSDFAALARLAAAAFADAVAPGTDGTLRLVWSRGSSASGPVGFVTVVPVSAAATGARRGVTCAALTNGTVTGIFADAPWLLAGVKSASYAQRMAAVREARERGCDEVLFVSADGYALDGPTSGLLWRVGDALVTTDVDAGGVLRSRTVEAVFAAAREEGVACSEALVTLDELVGADGVWLASSSRGVVPVLGVVRERGGGTEQVACDEGWTARVRAWAGF